MFNVLNDEPIIENGREYCSENCADTDLMKGNNEKHQMPQQVMQKTTTYKPRYLQESPVLL